MLHKRPYTPWPNLQEEGIESLWLTLRPAILPRHVVGAIYHPPSADSHTMVQLITNSLEVMLQHHPGAGIIVAGAFNQLKTSTITSGLQL